MHKPLPDCLAKVVNLFDLSAETLLALVDGEFQAHFNNIVGQGRGGEASAEPAASTLERDREASHGCASPTAEAGAREVAIGVTSGPASECTDLTHEVLEEWETVQCEWEKLKSVVEVAVKVQTSANMAMARTSTPASTAWASASTTCGCT